MGDQVGKNTTGWEWMSRTQEPMEGDRVREDMKEGVTIAGNSMEDFLAVTEGKIMEEVEFTMEEEKARANTVEGYRGGMVMGERGGQNRLREDMHC